MTEKQYFNAFIIGIAILIIIAFFSETINLNKHKKLEKQENISTKAAVFEDKDIEASLAAQVVEKQPPESTPAAIQDIVVVQPDSIFFPKPIPQVHPILEDTLIQTNIPANAPFIKGEVNFYDENTLLHLTVSKSDGTTIFNDNMGNILLPDGLAKFPLDTVMVYLEQDRSAIDIACHAWIDYAGRFRNCEQLRNFLEGPLHQPYSVDQANNNASSLINGQIIIQQNNKAIRGIIEKVARLNIPTAKENSKKSDRINEITGFKTDINLMTCSRTLPGDPDYNPNVYLGGYPDTTGRWILSIKIVEENYNLN